MKNAYATSGKIFAQVSMRQQPAIYEQLQAIKGNEIVVVRGTYDHIEKLLDTIKVPYETINSEQIAKYNGGRVMFVNCKDYSTGVPVKAVKEFVESGGRIVTTDWALGLVTKSFPKRLEKVGVTADEVVEIQAHTDMARKFLGLNYSQCHPQWWLENSSHLYQIKEGVIPLITSEEMKEKHGTPYVAVGFAEGKGEVIHFISHLELQRSRLKTKADAGTLDDFLAKMKVDKTSDMEDAVVADLEAAYSTLNTLAHLCVYDPIVSFGTNSVMSTKNAKNIADLKSLKSMPLIE
ncbi:MAG: hypothetical protein ACMXYG_07625 [Candidatus Woesearchaeota archaeon]